MIIDDHTGSIEFSVSVRCRKKYTILLFQTIVETTKKNYYYCFHVLFLDSIVIYWINLINIESPNNDNDDYT